MSLLLDLQLVPDRILWAVKDRIMANRDALEKRRQRERILSEGRDGASGDRLPLSSGSGDGYSQSPGHRPVGRRGGAQQGRYVRPEPFVPAFGGANFRDVWFWTAFSDFVTDTGVPEYERFVTRENQYVQHQWLFQDDVSFYEGYTSEPAIGQGYADIGLLLPTGSKSFIAVGRCWTNDAAVPIAGGTVIEELNYTYYTPAFDIEGMYPDKPGPLILEGPYQGVWRHIERGSDDGVIRMMYQTDYCYVGDLERIRSISAPASITQFFDGLIGSGPMQTFIPSQPGNVIRPTLTTIDPQDYPGHYVRSPEGVYTPYTGFDFYYQTADYTGGAILLGLETEATFDDVYPDQLYPVSGSAFIFPFLTGDAVPPISAQDLIVSGDPVPSQQEEPPPSNVFLYPGEPDRGAYGRRIISDSFRPTFCREQLLKLGFSEADLTP